jgi:curli biogenesis system outer membrane secretion channel CsgG
MLQNLFLYAGLALLVKTMFVATRSFAVVERSMEQNSARTTRIANVALHIVVTFACFALSLKIAGLLDI